MVGIEQQLICTNNLIYKNSLLDNENSVTSLNENP